MFLIVTRNFPPDIGGMQVLMGGLSEILIDHGPMKVITYHHDLSNIYDSKSQASIERIKGIKLILQGTSLSTFANSCASSRLSLTPAIKVYSTVTTRFLSVWLSI